MPQQKPIIVPVQLHSTKNAFCRPFSRGTIFTPNLYPENAHR